MICTKCGASTKSAVSNWVDAKSNILIGKESCFCPPCAADALVDEKRSREQILDILTEEAQALGMGY